MTGADLHDWICMHDCEAEPLAEHKARIIYYYNKKKPDRTAYLPLPLDKPVKDYTVYYICSVQLHIPVPDHAKYMKGVQARIEKDNKHGKK